MNWTHIATVEQESSTSVACQVYPQTASLNVYKLELCRQHVITVSASQASCAILVQIGHPFLCVRYLGLMSTSAPPPLMWVSSVTSSHCH